MKITATKIKNTAFPRYSTQEYVWRVRAVKGGVTHFTYANREESSVLEGLFRKATRPPRPSEIVMEKMDKEGKLRRSNETTNNIE